MVQVHTGIKHPVEHRGIFPRYYLQDSLVRANVVTDLSVLVPYEEARDTACNRRVLLLATDTVGPWSDTTAPQNEATDSEVGSLNDEVFIILL